MSWQATAWADSLPYDLIKSHLAYRVLIKLCNTADQRGRASWRSKKELALELGVSERSIQRAYSELEMMRLILPGDQDYVKHIRTDRRPKVFDMNLRYLAEYEQAQFDLAHGETGLSTGEPRGDNYGSNGETTAVAHRTTHELPTRTTTQTSHTAPVSPTTNGPVIVPSLVHCTGSQPHVFPDEDDESQCRRCWIYRYQLIHDEQQLQARREQGP